MDLKVLAFIVLSIVVLPLVAYNAAVLTTNYTSEQQAVVDYVYYFGALQGNFTSAETSHLEDVKKVMKGANIVFFTALIALLFLGFYLYKLNELGDGLFYGGVASLVAISFFGLIGVLSFDYLFEAFHRVFFPQGNWMFAADSLIITLFLAEFFAAAAGKILIFVLLLSAVFMLVGYRLKNKK